MTKYSKNLNANFEAANVARRTDTAVNNPADFVRVSMDLPIFVESFMGPVDTTPQQLAFEN
jgi:hypothetical protein